MTLRVIPQLGITQECEHAQCMVEWKTAEGHLFNQTLLVNWIDPETSSAMSD